MIANEVFKITLSLLFEQERDADEYRQHAVPLINLLLPELFKTDALMRRARELEPLTEIPRIETLEDDIPYADELLRTALPYALAAKFVYDDNDMSKVSYYQNLYVNAVNSFSEFYVHDVEDVYA